jgi:hypothetical protein
VIRKRRRTKGEVILMLKGAWRRKRVKVQVICCAAL